MSRVCANARKSHERLPGRYPLRSNAPRPPPCSTEPTSVPDMAWRTRSTFSQGHVTLPVISPLPPAVVTSQLDRHRPFLRTPCAPSLSTPPHTECTAKRQLSQKGGGGGTCQRFLGLSLVVTTAMLNLFGPATTTEQLLLAHRARMSARAPAECRH
eukprot:1782155-Rhodomonas_salina.1